MVALVRLALEVGFCTGFTSISRPKKSVGGWGRVNAERQFWPTKGLTLSAMSIFLSNFCRLFPGADGPSSGSSRDLGVHV